MKTLKATRNVTLLVPREKMKIHDIFETRHINIGNGKENIVLNRGPTAVNDLLPNAAGNMSYEFE